MYYKCPGTYFVIIKMIIISKLNTFDFLVQIIIYTRKFNKFK